MIPGVDNCAKIEGGKTRPPLYAWEGGTLFKTYQRIPRTLRRNNLFGPGLSGSG
jgi:hypothetical protein